MSVHSPLERRAHDIGASARGHDFFAGGHERRAHDASLFETAAAAVALLQVADERAVLEGKREHRLEREFKRTPKVFRQMIVDLVTAIGKKLYRIKKMFWTE